MTNLKGRYHVFIDESEFVSDQLVTLGALLVPIEKMSAVERDVKNLREVIGRKMRRTRYTAYSGSEEELKAHRCRPQAARLRAGELPEIHAKEMWQSQGAYHCARSPESLIRRNEWVDRVTRIIEKHSLIYMTRSFQGKHREFKFVTLLGQSSPIFDFITPDLSTNKIAELENDIHFAITFEIFMELNSLDEVGIKIESVTCDKGKRSELFGRFAGFDRARPFGYWQNFPNPIFEDSHSSAGLQLSDFITYFQAKVLYYNDSQLETPEWKIYQRLRKFHRTFQTSVAQAEMHKAIRPERRYRKLLLAMQIEAALLHSGGQSRSLAFREEAVRRLAKFIFSEQV